MMIDPFDVLISDRLFYVVFLIGPFLCRISDGSVLSCPTFFLLCATDRVGSVPVLLLFGLALPHFGPFSGSF